MHGFFQLTDRRAFPDQSSRHALAAYGVSAIDRERMRSVAAFTAETLSTDHPMPFGADTVSTATVERLMRAVNRVGPDHDPARMPKP